MILLCCFTSSFCLPVHNTAKTHAIHKLLTFHSMDQSSYHEEKPEDVKTCETGNKCKLHVLHRVVDINANFTGTVTFLVELVDNVAWEKPDSKVDPGGQH